jgi:hypothetical protein
MMLEQTLINPNFAGRDGFKWFIGQIIGSDSGKDNKLGCRAKVRILGHHPGDNQIKDDNLPWAHVVMPLGLGSGSGYSGVNPNFRGGEIVLGFFLDGDDAQQPIIIGSLYESGYGIAQGKSFSQVLTQGTSEFKPFVGRFPNNKMVQPIGAFRPAGRGIPKSDGKVNASSNPGESVKPNEVIESKGDVITNNTGNVVNVPSYCENGNKKFNKLQQALINFIKFLNTIEIINGQYINKVLNKVVSITGEISSVANVISDILIGIIRTVRNDIIDKIYEMLSKFFGISIEPPVIKLAKRTAVESIIDSIICAFEKILSQLVSFVINFLTDMVGKVLNVAVCAVESFLGNIIGTITNAINSAIGPALSQITQLIGGSFGSITNFIGKALGITKSVLSLLSCEDKQCYENFDYEMNKGFVNPSNQNLDRILNYSLTVSANNLAKDAKTVTNNWLSQVGISTNSTRGDFGSCDTNVFECGFPRITLFGGNGLGANAEAVVNSVGQIMGALITNRGSSYTTPPYVSITDTCGFGGGASAYAEISDQGEVTNIVVTNPGNNYLGPINENETSPCFIKPSTETGTEVSSSISKVIIINTGIGYSSSDSITDSTCPNNFLANPVVDDDGRIIDIKVINPGSSINTYPNLQINSSSGEGADLLPVLSFKKLDQLTLIERNVDNVKTVIYCSEKNDI